MQARCSNGEARGQGVQGVVSCAVILSRTICVILFLGLLVPSAGTAQSTPPARAVTLPEAEGLVRQALDPRSLALPGFGLDNYKYPDNPDFYFFEAAWDHPSNLGHFAVNMKTGDVWDPFLCTRYHSRRLLEFQKVMRKKIGLSEQEYLKLRKQRPIC